MTEDEKQSLREAKAKSNAELANIRLGKYAYALQDTDPRLLTYANNVIRNHDQHNLYELLALRRFFSLLDKYEWKPAKVRNFIRFYELLRFNGTHGRQRYKLTPIQVFQFASIFGFVDKLGRRLTRTAYIFVPRKFSKTTSAASLAVYDMLFGDNNAQAYVGANSYQQAKICFDEIRAIMRDIDPSGRYIKINREKISWLARGRDSFIQCLSGNAKTQDGLFASLVIMDEYSQARNTAGKNGSDLKNVLTSSMGPRREPLTVIITTASEVVDGPFAHELEGVQRVLRGEAEADTMFASLFMPDVDDKEDDPNTWAKVQPHLGITVQPDFYLQEWQTAQLSTENLLAFRTKLLNIFAVNDQKVWLPYEKCKNLCKGFDEDSVFRNKPMAAAAFDLSIHDDFSAVAYACYHNRHWYAHIDYYFPEGALDTHPNRRLYRQWAEQGHLHLCKGECIDPNMIAEDIMAFAEQVTLVRIGYDAWKAQDLTNLLSALGCEDALLPFRQGIGYFNLPVEYFEMLAYHSPVAISLNANPINVFCLSNCVLDEDNNGNRKPKKMSDDRKIDGVIALLMAIGELITIER